MDSNGLDRDIAYASVKVCHPDFDNKSKEEKLNTLRQFRSELLQGVDLNEITRHLSPDQRAKVMEAATRKW